MINNSIEEIRSLCSKLVTPKNNLDLKDVVQKVIDDLNQNSPIKTSFPYSVINESVADDLKLNIYRIIQEQTNNILNTPKQKM